MTSAAGAAPLDWRVTAAVAAGGALGAAARWSIEQVSATPPHGFPWSTFGLNVAGCLAIGLLLGVDRGPLLRAFAGTGLLGGFTTFSTYAVQGDALWRAGRPWLALGYLAVTVVCALAAAGVGVLLARRRR